MLANPKYPKTNPKSLNKTTTSRLQERGSKKWLNLKHRCLLKIWERLEKHDNILQNPKQPEYTSKTRS